MVLQQKGDHRHVPVEGRDVDRGPAELVLLVELHAVSQLLQQDPGGLDVLAQHIVTRALGAAKFDQRLANEAGEDEEVLIADLDLGSVREARVDLLFWRDRRPDTYDALAAP